MDRTFDRTILRVAARLLLAGQVSYVLVTVLHTGGEANDHPAIFRAYAASAIWTGVHVAQFACMSILIAGLIALFSAFDGLPGSARLASRFGTAAATAALGLCGAILAVDGVALKRAVNAWAAAPAAEQTARFAAAETMRWLEWGTRSYENFAMGLALLCAALLVRTAPLPKGIAFLMGLAAAGCLAQGWVAGIAGFSPAHTVAIIGVEAVNAVWMTWLLVRTPGV